MATRNSVFGLTDEEAKASESLYGLNILPVPSPTPLSARLLEKFDDPLIKILFLALAITTILAVKGYAEWLESIGILVALTIATFVSTYSEHRSEINFRVLQTEGNLANCKVFRNGSLRNILISNIVIGDYVLLSPGDKVPGDGYVYHGKISVSQQALTGESEPLMKMNTVAHIPNNHHIAEADSPSPSDSFYVFRESIVYDGEAIIRIAAVGTSTLYGKIAAEISVESSRLSPLQVKLAKLAQQISILGHLGAVLIAISFLFKQVILNQGLNALAIIQYLRNWPHFMKDAVNAMTLSIIVIVVAVPEGLPMMIAIVLALNMQRLLRSNILVRSLLGIEAAGSLDIIFIDKTGTLTEGSLVANLFFTGDQVVFQDISDLPDGFRHFVDFAIRNSSPSVASYLGTQSADRRKPTILGGNSTDRALLSWAYNNKKQSKQVHVSRCRQLLFGSAHKYAIAEFQVFCRRKATMQPSSDLHTQANVKEYSDIGGLWPHDIHGDDDNIGFNNPDASIINIISSLASQDDNQTKATTTMPTPGQASSFLDSAPIIPNEKHWTPLVFSIITGAPEVILTQCTAYYTPDGGRVNSAPPCDDLINELSTNSIRTVAIASFVSTVDGVDIMQPAPTSPKVSDDNISAPKALAMRDKSKNDSLFGVGIDGTFSPDPSAIPALTLIGVFGLSDQLRPDSISATQCMKHAGIQVVMITGDLDQTAISFAKKLNLIKKAAPLSCISSKDLQNLTDEQVIENLPHMRVVSRAVPTDKSRLVRLAQRANHIVGMTGDGVNDAAALKQADVGFGLGSGTEIAKEASDIIIMNNSMEAITETVMYGRTIFSSIRKFIVFQSTTNLASMVIVFLGPFLGYDFPITLTQLLWLNLVMDTLSAIAFGGEPARRSIMRVPPIPRDAQIMSPNMLISVFWNGLYIAALSIAFMLNDSILNVFRRESEEMSEKAFLTGFFCFFIYVNAFNAFSVRTPKLNPLHGIMLNPIFALVFCLIFVVQYLFTYIGGEALRTVPLRRHEWLFLSVVASTIIPFDIIRKKFIQNARGHETNNKRVYFSAPPAT